MPDFKLSFQEEVRRLARKEVNAFNETIAAQQKTIRALTKRIAELEKNLNVSIDAASAKEEKAADVPASAKPGKVRFSPKSLLKFRKKHGISQKAVAAILGVTTFTVSHWELGKNRPKGKQIEAISALMKSGKRKIEALLSEAQNNLGACYEDGTGVEKDVTRALYWYRKAAEQGDEKAKRNYVILLHKIPTQDKKIR